MTTADERATLAYLREVLTGRFDDEELRSLSFDLGVDYDLLEGESKAGKARELVAYFERRRRVPELLKVAKRQRPDIDWENLALESRRTTPLPVNRKPLWVALGIAGISLAVIAGTVIVWSLLHPATPTPSHQPIAVASPPDEPALASIATTSAPSSTVTRMATPVPKPTATQLPPSPSVEPSIQPTLPLTITNSTDGAVMVLVPAGPFAMGRDAMTLQKEWEKCPKECGAEANLDRAGPARVVTLEAFYIDRYEVTNAQYRKCVEATGCSLPGAPKDLLEPAKERHPVTGVSWDQARVYCKWRSDRLPTEAEWEKAARGTDNRLYPWGDSVDGRRGTFCDSTCAYAHADKNYNDGVEGIAPVGSYPDGVSPYGVYDMGGNVFEWVEDGYQPYPGYLGPEWEVQKTPLKVMRGGCWFSCAYQMVVSLRLGLKPSEQGNATGIRCARFP